MKTGKAQRHARAAKQLNSYYRKRELMAPLHTLTVEVKIRMASSGKKKVRRYDSIRPPEPKQFSFIFDLGEELRWERETNPTLPPEKRKFVTVRKCLRCDRTFRSKVMRICARCKRHEDYLDGGDDDHSVEF